MRHGLTVKTHFFQRYHSKENVHTANALLLLARVYHYDPRAFFAFVESELIGEQVDLDVSFELQTRLTDSVPDAVIGQPSFKIVVETKIGSDFHRKQIDGHLKAFGSEETRLLLTLDTSALSSEDTAMVQEAVENANNLRIPTGSSTPIAHVHLRFQDLIEKLEPYIDERDSSMVAMFEDYKQYCFDSDLIENTHQFMRAINVSTTLEECRQFDLYYHNTTSPYRGQAYIGLYKSKEIHAVGKIVKTLVVTINEQGKLVYHTEDLASTDEVARIHGAMEAAKVARGWDGWSAPHAFYLVDRFVDTSFVKTSPYGIQRTKLFDVYRMKASLPGGRFVSPPSTEELAIFLNGKKWEDFEDEIL